MFSSAAKEAAFDVVVKEAAEDSDKCDRAKNWVKYATEQATFYNSLLMIPAFAVAVALVVAIGLILVDTDAASGAAISAAVLGVVGAGSLFAFLKGLASDAETRRVKAEEQVNSACGP